jgi:hypothetical protein
MTGESAGLTVLELGGNGRFPGKSARAAETAARIFHGHFFQEQRDADRLLALAIENGGNLAFAAQGAGGALAVLRAQGGLQYGLGFSGFCSHMFLLYSINAINQKGWIPRFHC